MQKQVELIEYLVERHVICYPIERWTLENQTFIVRESSDHMSPVDNNIVEFAIDGRRFRISKDFTTISYVPWDDVVIFQFNDQKYYIGKAIDVLKFPLIPLPNNLLTKELLNKLNQNPTINLLSSNQLIRESAEQLCKQEC